MSYIIKEFSEFIPDEVKWSIEVTSNADVSNLTKEQIDDAMNCFYAEEYQEFHKSLRSKVADGMNDPVGKWQIEKGNEIENKWYDNMSYNIDGNVLTASSKFEVAFTDEFDKADVMDWTEGFHRLVKVWPMLQMERLVKNQIVPKPSDDIQREFLIDLRTNQKYNVKKIG